MSWIQRAKPGDKVQCRGGSWVTEDFEILNCSKPKIGEVYTIRSIDADDDGVFFLLEEVRNDLDECGHEPDFHAGGFRPVYGIEAFTSMLTKEPQRVREEA